MTRIPAGRLLMGSVDFYPEEGPVHEREIEAFDLDPYPVTNAEYLRFVTETGYVTVAERPLDPREFPGADPATLVPGGLVFTPTDGPVNLNEWQRWWRWQPGAHWRAPEGPGSDVDGRLEHPVVQIAFEDASAYAAWAHKRLPTEAEWEWAARGGLVGARYAWGEELRPDGELMANTWQGDFPYRNSGAAGFIGTSATGAFPANGFGVHDMIGNVWEWTADTWSARHSMSPTIQPGERRNLLGVDAGGPPRRVTKGGSHLCAPEYCRRYRPAARSSQTEDSATTHLGFRCAR
ncbi:formylglycine-generating enzyme family protein [Microbacterium foliorum]|uniref:Serine/threonine-protein kinase pkn1 n=1 Tax=Microbacterium foliorum TaxID=104336 RepID=A0A0F0KFS6_9MICO|nr:formylglycine-generating enzyme family protein [Microbacterium foliorum]AXL13677.1 formylglycine-generating enzyme family protein [Microbacterium foliorum]KJL19274.1 Serine/threonine-protein kinase pkn1 [Microbacterium foliorum]